MQNLLTQEAIRHLEALPEELQRQVLALLRVLDLSQEHDVPGRELLKFAGAIPASDLAAMSSAIEQGCETVDANETISGSPRLHSNTA